MSAASLNFLLNDTIRSVCLESEGLLRQALIFVESMFPLPCPDMVEKG